MSERLQITVPEDVARAWREAAEATGVSLSAWVALRANRPDCDRILTQIKRKLDGMSKSDAPTFDEEEKDMITQLRHAHGGKAGKLNLEQVLRLGVRAAYRQIELNAEDLQVVRGE